MSNERAEIDQPFSRQLHADTHPLHEVGPPHVGVVDVDRFPIPHPDLDLSWPALVLAQDQKHPVARTISTASVKPGWEGPSCC